MNTRAHGFQPRPWRHVIRIWLLCMVVMAFMPGLSPGWAQPAEDESLESVMEGFEAETAPAESDSLEEIVSGFEDEVDNSPAPRQPRAVGQAVTIDGTAKLGGTWNYAHPPPEDDATDWRGLSRLRSEIQLEMQFKPQENWRVVAGAKAFHDAAYTIRGENRFTDEVIDLYRQEAEWREVYAQGRLSRNFDLKFGRQIVVWGRSDNIRIADVLNPLDMREPGLTDIEDLRLPVTMTRLDGFHGPWNLSTVAIHEIRFNKDPVFGSDFFPADMPLPGEQIPSHGGENTEWGVALTGVFSGWDISFYWADLFNDQAHAAPGNTVALQRQHARITMHGAAGNLALGNWLLKAEAAYFTGLKFFNADTDDARRLDGLIGFEYSGWDETTVSWEWAVRHLFDFDPQLKAAPDFAQEDEIVQALRISRDFANDTINLTLLALAFGRPCQEGFVGRISMDYDWTDAVTVKAGLVLYQSGDKYTLKQIGDNDRIFAEIAYRF